MRYRLLNVAIATLMLGAAPARASDPPSFEQSGFPVTPHQVALLGAENVQEQTPAPMLSIAGMPASPHQIAVLNPGTERFKPSAWQAPSEAQARLTRVITTGPSR
jgi:hypothetical protein